MRRKQVAPWALLFLSQFVGLLWVTDGRAQEAESGVPEDPQGVRGISPAWKEIKAGDDAFVAGQREEALKRYEAALQHDPKHAMAHFRLGEALRAQGEMARADDAFDNASRFAQDPRVKAKILYARADLAERTKQLDLAQKHWTLYVQFVDKAHAVAVVGLAALAEERQARVVALAKMLADYVQVRERINPKAK